MSTKTIKYPEREQWAEILKRPTQEKANLESIVSGVFEAIKTNGDQALKEFTAKFDGAHLEQLQVTKAELAAAAKDTPLELAEVVSAVLDNFAL